MLVSEKVGVLLAEKILIPLVSDFSLIMYDCKLLFGVQLEEGELVVGRKLRLFFCENFCTKDLNKILFHNIHRQMPSMY
jgi:hypothetical protein